MYKIIEITPLEDYRLFVKFEDGVAGEIDLSDKLFGVFEGLKDENLFRQARLDEFGAVCWPNNADLAPDGIYKTLQ